MSRVELAGVLLAYSVEDVPDGGFEGLEIGVGFGPQPLVFDFAPEGLDFVQVGTVSRQVENMHVAVFPVLKPRPERGGVMQAGIVEDQHRGAGAGGDPGVERVDDKGRVHGCLAGRGVQLVGGGVEQAQHVEPLAVAGLGGDLFARELPAVRDGRGQAKAGFIAVKQLNRAFFFQFLHLAQLVRFAGVLVRVLGRFQAVAEAPPFAPTLFKKRFSVRSEKSLRSS